MQSKAETERLNYEVPEMVLNQAVLLLEKIWNYFIQVGTIKVNKYVSIDGGMSDHIRTALYGAKYQALLVNRHEEADETVTIL